MVRRALTRQTRWCKIVALPLKLKILSSKNRFGKFWNFDPWWPQFWPEPKNDRNDFEMIFRELSNAVFRFVLRCAGAEIDGGGGVFKRVPDKISKSKISNRKISNAKYRKQNIEIAKYRNRRISNIEVAKYRNAKYRIRKISKSQNIVSQNIEWQNIEYAKYRRTKYRTQNIERKISKWHNIESKISKWQNIERKLSKWLNIERKISKWQNIESLADLLLSELELRGKNYLVSCRKTKRLVYKLKVLGQPVTSEVRSSAEKRRKPVIAGNFASDGARAKFQHPACSSRRVEHV